MTTGYRVSSAWAMSGQPVSTWSSPRDFTGHRDVSLPALERESRSVGELSKGALHVDDADRLVRVVDVSARCLPTGELQADEPRFTDRGRDRAVGPVGAGDARFGGGDRLRGGIGSGGSRSRSGRSGEEQGKEEKNEEDAASDGNSRRAEKLRRVTRPIQAAPCRVCPRHDESDLAAGREPGWSPAATRVYFNVLKCTDSTDRIDLPVVLTMWME